MKQLEKMIPYCGNCSLKAKKEGVEKDQYFKMEELSRLHNRIEELVIEERFGANHSDYLPNVNLFELLVGQFYDQASKMECSPNVMMIILDRQRSLNGQFMYLRSRKCINKFEVMKNIFSEIDQVMTELKKI